MTVSTKGLYRVFLSTFLLHSFWPWVPLGLSPLRLHWFLLPFPSASSVGSLTLFAYRLQTFPLLPLPIGHCPFIPGLRLPVIFVALQLTTFLQNLLLAYRPAGSFLYGLLASAVFFVACTYIFQDACGAHNFAALLSDFER